MHLNQQITVKVVAFCIFADEYSRIDTAGCGRSRCTPPGHKTLAELVPVMSGLKPRRSSTVQLSADKSNAMHKTFGASGNKKRGRNDEIDI